jgi:hypothetical protein
MLLCCFIFLCSVDLIRVMYCGRSRMIFVFRLVHWFQNLATCGIDRFETVVNCTVLYYIVLYCTDSHAVSPDIPCLVLNPRFHDLFTGPCSYAPIPASWIQCRISRPAYLKCMWLVSLTPSSSESVSKYCSHFPLAYMITWMSKTRSDCTVRSPSEFSFTQLLWW